MPVYHSVVVEADGKDNGKTLYIMPRDKPEKTQKKKRLGTFAKVLLGGAIVLILIFLIASLGQYLYEAFGPEPDKSMETFENTHKEFQPNEKSEISRFLTSKFTIQAVAVVLLAILGKFFWGEDDDE
ncbi:hypothetical protein GCK72_020695 [Caenorhabditis remanei]|uniref:Uncharacterized protein n=1 Tax=Caenorhabditis remanei TaxID=31234 RepID=A0A6A5GHU4_CAERE|nr:hypothetical protein GCK72_020695 [Caenorhabditis remanei]KAF1754135.1 hypothetical protein GCK72_020695 [Caenorhabditis remanei]